MGDFFVKDNLAGLRREDFQATVQGKKVDLFILKNKKGSEIAVTNFAGALCAIMMPDRDGKMESVVWGHDSLQHVMGSQETYLSVLIGRYGNRIAAASSTHWPSTMTPTAFMAVPPVSTNAYSTPSRLMLRHCICIICARMARRASPAIWTSTLPIV